MTRTYEAVAAVLIVLGLLIWLTNPFGDVLETTLWRDAFWGIAAAISGYAAGLRSGTGKHD